MSLKIAGRVTGQKRTAGAFCGAECEVKLLEMTADASHRILASRVYAAVFRESDGTLIEYCDSMDAAMARASALSHQRPMVRDAGFPLRNGKPLCHFEGLQAVAPGAGCPASDTSVRLWQAGQHWHFVFDNERSLGAFMAEIAALLGIPADRGVNPRLERGLGG
ncbi:hypothetical protein KPL74_06270 [Bacillus sp. NP157]|nr:hypothetical protein KPL74_06270 [Bacillus sp. NP157]